MELRHVVIAAAILLVIALASIGSVCCSSKNEGVPDVGTRVRQELNAGEAQRRQEHAEEFEREIRSRRLQAAKLLKEGKKVEARQMMNSIPELEATVKRLRGGQD